MNQGKGSDVIVEFHGPDRLSTTSDWLRYDQVPDAIRRRHVKGSRMASEFRITCDQCGTVMGIMKGWAAVEISNNPTRGGDNDPVHDATHHDFCPDCWKAMRVLLQQRKAAGG